MCDHVYHFLFFNFCLSRSAVTALAFIAHTLSLFFDPHLHHLLHIHTPTSTLHPTFPPPLSPEQVWWPPWPLEPFYVVIPLASLGQSPCSSNLMVAGHLHRLQLQASTSSMCPLCHLLCHHILSHILFLFCHFDLAFHQLPILKRSILVRIPWLC